MILLTKVIYSISIFYCPVHSAYTISHFSSLFFVQNRKNFLQKGLENIIFKFWARLMCLKLHKYHVLKCFFGKIEGLNLVLHFWVFDKAKTAQFWYFKEAFTQKRSNLFLVGTFCLLWMALTRKYVAFLTWNYFVNPPQKGIEVAITITVVFYSYDYEWQFHPRLINIWQVSHRHIICS